MKKKPIIWLFAWMCLVSTALFAHNPPSYDLLPKFREGQRWVFKEAQQIQVSSEIIPGGTQKVFIKNKSMEEVVKVYPDGRVDLKVVIQSANSDNPNFAFKLFDISKLINLPMVIKLDAKGKVEDVVPLTHLPEDSRAAFNLFKEKSIHNNGYENAPAKPVTFGEAWHNEHASSMESPLGVVDSIQKIQSRLVKVEHYAGRKCLEVAFQGEFTGAMGQGSDGSMEGNFTGKRMVDEETGINLHLELAIEESVSQISPDGEVTFEYKVNFIRELSEEAAIR